MNKIESKNNPGDFVSGFAYPNNAIIENDFLYLRDENGNIIDGKVTVGDRITVLKVVEEKKLALVQYPVGEKVKQGYVTNSSNVIKYFNQDKWINKNTKTDVYADRDLNERIGSVDPNERATLLYKDYGKWYIVYSTSSGKNSKSGFVNFDGGGVGGSDIVPGDLVPEGFTYANNAVIENDFLYLRDANGNQIAGRTVSVGDKITVIDISYSKQLALVQYPTSSGVRQGYVTNSTNIIKYLNPYNWYNGSTAETVYLDATGNSTFGTINPYEAATLLYKKDNRYHIVYDTSKGMLTKSGYVDFKGLDAPASNITIPSISLSGVEKIQYGTSGNGRPLNAYKIGNGSKILFAGFAIHGFEDNWFRDGEALVKIATELVHKFASYNQTNGLHGWTVYIGQCMNPDGVIQGVTNNGPGRCAVTTGIDLNRSFPTGFVVRTDSRYKTGPSPLAAIEASALKNFISDLHSKASEMVVIDGHGWLNCTYGNSTIASYFTRQFGFSHNGGAGGGFFARWAESLSNTRAVLVEYPSSTRSYNDVLNGNYIGKTYNAMLNIIRDNPGTGGGSGSGNGNGEEEFYKNAEVKAGTKAVNIRETPSTTAKILGILAGGAKLDISRRIKPSGDSYYWYRIIFEDKYAYIREDFVTMLSDAVAEEEFYKNAEVKAGTTAVNIRKGPSINAEWLGTLAGGAKLDISRRIKPSGDSYYWYRIIFEGKYAYIREDFVTILSDVVGDDYDKNENYHRVIELAKPFMKGADIKKVQNKLNKLGFNAGSEDGIYGYSTEDQIIKFQKNKGLVADGKVGPATWDALMNTSSGGGSGSGSYDPNGSYHRVLRYQTPMMTGEDVKAVQKKLNEKISSGLSIDGSFGQGTESSVRTFQQRNNLSIDGAVGQNTWNKLMESFIDEVNMSPIAFGTALFDLKTYPDIISVITGNSPSLIMVPKGVEVPIQAVYENCYAIYYFNEVRYIKNYTLSNYLELESYNDVKEFEKDLNLMIRPNDPIKGLPIASIYPHVFTFFDMNEDEASFSDSKGKKRMVRKKINGSFFTPFNFRVNYKSFGYDNLINPISKSIFFETFYDHFGKFSACLGAIGVSIEALDVIYQHVKACERDGLKINWPFIVKKVIKEIAVNAGATVAITAIVGAIAGIIAAYFGIKIIFVSALLTFILTLILGPVFVTLGEALYDFLISVFEHCENFISGRKMIKLT